MALLQPDQIDRELDRLDGWTLDGHAITRSVTADSFLAGLDLVHAVGRRAEEVDHHPDIDIRWRTITFTLSTHSDGGLTEKDFALAHDIDGLVG